MEKFIDRSFLPPEWNRGILPAHIIHQEKDDIGFFKRAPAAGNKHYGEQYCVNWRGNMDLLHCSYDLMMKH
jgi:hypothetical protein